MNLPVISQLVALIEEIFKMHGTEVVQVAEEVGIETAEKDPQVQAVTDASVALVTAAKTLKTAIETAPPVVPVK